MFRKINVYRTIVSGFIAALAFSIPVYFFISDDKYSDSWLLFVGSFLFMIVIGVHTVRESKRRENESMLALAFLSHATTITGILISVLFSFILLSLLVPGYLDAGNADRLLNGEPVNTIWDKTDGLSFEVFFAATVINFSVGSFTGIILPFYSKRSNADDPKGSSPLQHYGVK